MTKPNARSTADLSQMPPDGLEGTIYLLTIRGQLKAPSAEEARPIHNATAGNPAGVAACRSLGDLSHNVYVPAGDGPENEILILDRWTSVQGLGQFFADPQVQQGGDQIFESRDPVVWAPADVPAHHLPAPSGRSERYIGLLRATVRDLAKTAAAFTKAAHSQLNEARLYGQLENQTFFRAPLPGQPETKEVLGVSVWHDLEGMNDYYLNTAATEFIGPLVDGPPTTSVWKPAPGEWTEW